MTRSSNARRGGRQEATSEQSAAAPAGLGDSPPLYTLREVARHLNVSRSTLRRMIEAGTIPHIRVGAQLRFDILAVRAALDRHR